MAIAISALPAALAARPSAGRRGYAVAASEFRRQLREIRDEFPQLALAIGVGPRAEDGGRVDRRHDEWCKRRLEELAAMKRDLEAGAEQRLGGGRAEEHDCIGVNDL